MIRSLRSFSFLSPPKAILVPGMYFFGFSRYSNCGRVSISSGMVELQGAYESGVVPGDSLLLVGIGVCVALNGTGLAAEETEQVWADLVALSVTEGVALGASGLEEVGTLLGITCRCCQRFVSCHPGSTCAAAMWKRLQ